tara:strand:- start:6 stop:461 length:456 start_codon:yes stop_codon:yes gene_type:complete
MNSLIKISTILFIILPFFAHGKDVLKAKEGITWDSENQEYVATGSVIYESKEIKILCDYLRAEYEIENEKEIFNEIEIKGSIEIFYNEEIYYSDYGLYFKQKDLVELYDNVKIVSEDRILKGDKLIIDLKNNTRTMSASKKESVVEVFINE